MPGAVIRLPFETTGFAPRISRWSQRSRSGTGVCRKPPYIRPAWTQRGQVFETAKTESGRIVVRSEGQDGQVRTTAYELNADGSELTVLTTFKPPWADKDVSLRSVYVREKRK